MAARPKHSITGPVRILIVLGAALLLLPINAHWSLYATHFSTIFVLLLAAAIYVTRGLGTLHAAPARGP